MYDGEDIANCPSCTLRIRVIFDEDSLPGLLEEEEEEEEEGEKVKEEEAADRSDGDQRPPPEPEACAAAALKERRRDLPDPEMMFQKNCELLNRNV